MACAEHPKFARAADFPLTAPYRPVPPRLAPYRPVPPRTALTAPYHSVPLSSASPRTAPCRPVPPRTARTAPYRPVPPRTAPYDPVPPRTAPCRPVPPRATLYRSAPPRPVPPRTAPYRPYRRPVPPRTTPYHPVPPHTAPYRPVPLRTTHRSVPPMYHPVGTGRRGGTGRYGVVLGGRYGAGRVYPVPPRTAPYRTAPYRPVPPHAAQHCPWLESPTARNPIGAVRAGTGRYGRYGVVRAGTGRYGPVRGAVQGVAWVVQGGVGARRTKESLQGQACCLEISSKRRTAARGGTGRYRAERAGTGRYGVVRAGVWATSENSLQRTRLAVVKRECALPRWVNGPSVEAWAGLVFGGRAVGRSRGTHGSLQHSLHGPSVVSPGSSMHPRCCNRGVGTRPLPAARAHGKARAYNTGSMEGVL